MPEHLRQLLGDCFQSLRSALDHEVHALSVTRYGPLWPGLEKSAFPLSETEQSFRSQGRRQIAVLSAPTQAFVERVQPFRTPQDPVTPLLVLVHDVARVHRHRQLQLAAAQPHSFSFDPQAGRINLTIELRFVMNKYCGRDALGAAKQAIAAIAWTIDELRTAEANA